MQVVSLALHGVALLPSIIFSSKKKFGERNFGHQVILLYICYLLRELFIQCNDILDVDYLDDMVICLLTKEQKGLQVQKVDEGKIEQDAVACGDRI